MMTKKISSWTDGKEQISSNIHGFHCGYSGANRGENLPAYTYSHRPNFYAHDLTDGHDRRADSDPHGCYGCYFQYAKT